MLSRKVKFAWCTSLLFFSLTVGFSIQYPNVVAGTYPMPRAIGYGLAIWYMPGILALIYAAIQRFKADKMSAVFWVWTVGIIVFSIIQWLGEK
jgi:hypothetical protein